jgi:hypothetical protein
MGADARLRFGPDCADLVTGELRFATAETALDGFAFELGRTGLLFCRVELVSCGWGARMGHKVWRAHLICVAVLLTSRYFARG